ncbi:uncharacterized protein EAE97_011659 [Botrytis byssoidea]|uniref:Uncharacterized protein n=1 Tax=Botrytis byssoidea TaxID=139641 RepID=A0A9P5LJU0_9HELO|nr:uncharacterized protein EAE97_011659 [Botrytis byssoidea]KAF7919327.1 hypothetical protein EAE97_011659 [Botrytis byssoidea]
MSDRKKEFRQGASCKLHHTNLSFQEDLQPSFGPSRSPHPNRLCPPRHTGSCFESPNADDSYTYLRDCSKPEDFSHHNSILPPRRIRSFFRKKNQDDSHNSLRACDEESVIDDDAPGPRIAIVIPNAVKDNDQRHSHTQVQDDIHFPLPIRTEHRRKDYRISQNDERENVPRPPSCSASSNPSCPSQNSFYDSSNDQIVLLTEIHRLHERIDLLESKLQGNVRTTAYCRCSCHRSIRPMTPSPDNFWQRNEPELFPDPRNDWDESGEPGCFSA